MQKIIKIKKAYNYLAMDKNSKIYNFNILNNGESISYILILSRT